jgi:hypothetical protein
MEGGLFPIVSGADTLSPRLKQTPAVVGRSNIRPKWAVRITILLGEAEGEGSARAIGINPVRLTSAFTALETGIVLRV